MDIALFKEQIAVEKALYGDYPVFEYIEIQRKDFLIKLFCSYPKFRHQNLESFVFFCSHYLQDASFKKEVLKEVFIVCPTLVQRLYQINCFTKPEIKESLEFHRRKFLCLFFKNVIEVDSSGFIDDKEAIDYQYLLEDGNGTELESLIQFGFLKYSMEYCLKYDQFEEIERIMINNPNMKECKWSPFEWSEKPKSLNFLSFSGFFGSLKCFRILLLLGYVIDEIVVCNVIYSGSRVLFNIVSDLHFKNFSFVHEASKFFYLSVVEHLVNQKVDINAKDTSVEFIYFLGLLFIMLLKMVILVLLNILLIKKQK